MTTTSGGPTVSPTTGVGGGAQNQRLYSNPLFDFASEQMPKDIKSFFKYCEMVYANSPIIMNGISKLINYPIRGFKYKTTSEEKRKKTKDILENKLDLKAHLIQVGLEYFIYGNVYRTIYFPFNRFLKCGVCQQETNIESADFKVKKDKFILNCRCGANGKAEVVDRDIKNFDKLRLINWDPHAITLRNNPITGDTRYYYDIPSDIKIGAMRGDPVTINSLPKVFFEASVKNKKVEFGDNFYHLKCPSLSGYNSGYGLSPLISVLKLFMYQATLRKSGEAIAHEHIVPKNVLFPQANTSDPSVSSSLRTWKKELTNALEKWRYDKNYQLLAPYPTGVANLGSQGKALLPTNEIKETRNEMALSLGVPPDFIYNPSGIQKSTVSLAMLENQLQPFVDQLTNYMNWVVDMLNSKYELDLCEVELQDFSLTDDQQTKQMILQGSEQGGVSSTTVLESLGLDPNEEREQLVEEQLEEYKRQKDLEQRMRQIDQDVSQQTAEQQSAENEGKMPDYDQQAIIAKANEYAQKLIQMPYEQRRSHMEQIQNEDAVFHAVLTQELDTLHDQGYGPGEE